MAPKSRGGYVWGVRIIEYLILALPFLIAVFFWIRIELGYDKDWNERYQVYLESNLNEEDEDVSDERLCQERKTLTAKD